VKTKVCVIGSGAGAGPIIYELAKAGHEIVVLEKGPWIKRENFRKDEMSVTRRKVYTPLNEDEFHVLDYPEGDGWKTYVTKSMRKEFWNGSMVGGSSNLMSGYFHRMKPQDFRLLSEYGEIEGANMMDWPISYEDLAPYYDRVEELVGVSGRVVEHKHLSPRTKNKFPYPPLSENEISSWIDNTAEHMGYKSIPVPRAIISKKDDPRNPCYNSGFCGSYGCSSGAKGSSREALINPVKDLPNVSILPNSKVYFLETENRKIKKAWFYDTDGEKKSVEADIFVVACQATETSRLLLLSKNKSYKDGVGNSSGQVGKNLLFSGSGAGSGRFHKEFFDENSFEKLMQPGLFVNRCLQEWYEFEDEKLGKRKGGIVDFLWEHHNPVSRANKLKKKNGSLIYGDELQDRLEYYFKNQRKLIFEIFTDWHPNDDCNVSLSKKYKDKWGDPVAHLKLKWHKRNIENAKYLAKKAEYFMQSLGAENVTWSVSGKPPSNLQAGGCRFGEDPNKTVLDVNCKAHDTDNLYVTDGSFMPTGGSTTYTFTIYANSFRVADHLKERLS
jgi:choline dehydrogenase-like flavoprotein